MIKREFDFLKIAVLAFALSFFYTGIASAQSREDSIKILRIVRVDIPAYLNSKTPESIRLLVNLCHRDIVERDIYPDEQRLIIVGREKMYRVHTGSPPMKDLEYTVKRIRFRGEYKASITGSFKGEGLGGDFVFEFIRENDQWFLLKATNYHKI